MKVYLINPFNRTITETQIADGRDDMDSHMKEMYAALNCDLFTVACEINEQRDTIFVDDEGLLGDLDTQRFFVVELDDVQMPFAGMGLVMGLDDSEGDSIEPNCTLEQLQSVIRFVPNELLLIN